MSKIVAFIIAGGLVLAALAAFNIDGVNAREETKFVQFSVLAEDRANYGVDENSSTIPAVSIDIIEDKLHDSGLSSTIPVIKYTYLPAQTPKPVHHNNESQTVEQSEPRGNHENNGNGGNGNGNAGGNQNQDQNGNGGSNQSSGQQKGKDTKADKGSSTNSGGSSNTNASSQDKNKSNTSQTK